jgi:hypothetical protein
MESKKKRDLNVATAIAEDVRVEEGWTLFDGIEGTTTGL